MSPSIRLRCRSIVFGGVVAALSLSSGNGAAQEAGAKVVPLMAKDGSR